MNKPLRICIVCMSCIMLSGLIGLCTNLINAVISPEYFINIMHWEEVENLIRSAGAQGLYQGLGQGLFFALVFSCVYIISNNAELNISAVLKWIVCMGLASIGLWVIGGIIAIALSALSPEFYKQAHTEYCQISFPQKQLLRFSLSYTVQYCLYFAQTTNAAYWHQF